MGIANCSADNEGLELLQQIIAVIGIDFQRDRFGKIQAENTQDGLAINHMAANAQIQVVRLLVCDVHKVLDILRQAQFNIYSFHMNDLLLMSALAGALCYYKHTAKMQSLQGAFGHLPTFNSLCVILP